MAEELSRVRSEHKFDEGALQTYLMQNLVGFPRNHGEWTVLQYRFVLCNVTGALVLIMSLYKCSASPSVSEINKLDCT